ncbi:MAG: FAD-binding oxidoreductase [Deltaproteobacteria bacterium]|nr:FAD-binding oxidoreductase [Deltaproteobacteria bacterium]
MRDNDRLAGALKEITGETNVIDDPDKLAAYAIDGMAPRTIVFPGSVEEVSKILSHAFMEGLSVAPRGSGTKLSLGNLLSRETDIVLSSLRLNRVIDCDIGNLTLTAGSGITLKQTQEMLAKEGSGCFLPLDPPFTEQATLGGIVASNASGPRRYQHGTARDLVLGMRIVGPNGDVSAAGGKTVKNVTGYDMNKLHIGALGTLGFIAEVTFRLLPLPEEAATLLISFDAPEDAGAFIRKLVHSPFLPVFMELMNGGFASRLSAMSGKTSYAVALGFEGVAEAVKRQLAEIAGLAREMKSLAVISLAGDDHERIGREIRNYNLGLKNDFPDLIVLKASFVISEADNVTVAAEKLAQTAGLEALTLCHAGNGILYVYLPGEDEGTAKIEVVKSFIDALRNEVEARGGALVVEAASPAVKKAVSVWGASRSDSVVMRRLKELIDPVGILAPGRFGEVCDGRD